MRLRQSLASLWGECSSWITGSSLFLYEIAMTSPFRTGFRELFRLFSVLSVELRVGFLRSEGMQWREDAYATREEGRKEGEVRPNAAY